ncbi:sialidase family protein [Desertimonas flava]|uniref:sialidase family protein n=1 Tax=Desertimonas flava TaxID=2064846 RepID=UPI0013C4C326|nr:sialidase family protein [Desertimonas flava]
MTTITLLDHGTIDDGDSAFPQAVELADGTLLCSFSDAGGQLATGGTGLSRSADGRTWTSAGTLLAATTDPASTNYLKVSRAVGTGTVFAYGARSTQPDDVRFGDRMSEAIVCRSDDSAVTWGEPLVVPFPTAALEISHGVLALRSGRLLAPAATIEPGRLGAEVLVAISDDDGLTWPRVTVAMRDPRNECGFLEQKLAELPDGRILATAWTVTLSDVADRPNSFSISEDGGVTWSEPRSMGIEGQTLSALPVGGDRFAVLYNRRYGDQGIVAAAARFDGSVWSVEDETLVYDARRRREGREHDDGVDEMLDFQFGFPTALSRPDGSVLATFWSVEDGSCGVRWASLRIDW